MIRLIASDVDGTLIPEGAEQLHPDFINVVKQLLEKGYAFAVASGRPEISIKHVFREVADDIYFISNNGGMASYRNEIIAIRSMPDKDVKEILEFLRKQEDAFYLFVAVEGEYTECKDEEMLKWVREGYKEVVTVVDDLSLVEGTFMKLAVFFKSTDAIEHIEEAQALFGDRVSITVSGQHWMDFVSTESKKGIALADIQKKLGITKEETIAFGDNENDIPLLQAAEESYAVSNARENLKKVAKYILPDTTEETVLKVLKTLL